MTRPPKPAVTARQRGTGYITPVWSAEGWRFKARFPDGAGGEMTVGTFSAELDAHGALNAQVQARIETVDGRACAVSLGTWGERWIDGLRDRNRRSWRSTWLRTVSAAPFIDWPLDSIRRADIRGWAHGELLEHISERTGEVISRQSAKHALGLVRRALAAAVDAGLLAQNPAADVVLPPADEAHEDGWTFLEQQEVDRLLEHPDLPAKQRSAFAVAIYAGLRQGELCALRWENVELREDRPRIRVVGSWDGATKTNKTRRVPLLPVARAALATWWDQSKRPTAGLVWPSDKPAGAQHARGYDFGWGEARDTQHGVCWLGWRRRAGIGRRVRFHDLRHTCASHLVSGTWGRRWSLEEVQRVLGHGSRSTTERYAHLAEDALDHAAAQTVIRPESVRVPSTERAQQRETTLRAVGDSNPRPSAPEYQDSVVITSASAFLDGLRTDRRAMVDLVRGGTRISREDGEAHARAVLRFAKALAFAAGEVIAAPDDVFHARLLTLLEHEIGLDGAAEGEADDGDPVTLAKREGSP